MRRRILQAIESKGQRGARSTTDQNGQQMIEFTLTFMMLVALFAALLLMGWMFFSYATITSAAREGARHLMAHPTVPQDQVTFGTADEEATWVVTRSLSMLDWTQAVVNISPAVSQRVPGGYVLVEIVYTMSLPEIQIPLIVSDQVVSLGGPVQLRAMSRRSLD